MNEEGLTLVEHLTELRKRIIIVIITLLAATGVAFYFVDEIQNLMIRPGGEVDFIYLSPPELLMAHIKLALMAGLVGALPIIFYQVWAFVIPGIQKKQKIFLFLSVFFGTFFFVGGIIFAYLLILPLSIEFFAGMASEQVQPLFSFTSYIGFVTSILFAFGVAFELPMLVLLLTKFNLVRPRTLRRARKFVFLVVVVLSALITPPDIISQALLAGPMMILFEVSIIISSVIYRKKEKETQ
ncbi:twin-arginine translocase subunit TatC [Isachenkonia alkalipeptolytica]|uniref:twin-arginine translocase subunit TatC n=1 Tax=Isachenkonia alkalipeptolytica TaxID=2565777 RepID=UPI00136CAB3E|nr:twin-arginine translocase subunit TatC [Isachenkonia alkalipeptolytica]